MQNFSLSSSAPSAPARLRLDFLDGLRGMAALFVVIHHAYMLVARGDQGASLPPLLRHATNWLSLGEIGVDVFIVLSGFVLMLPVAGRGGQLTGGLAGFFRRRARRILPPYYFALAAALLVIAVLPATGRLLGFHWSAPLRDFDIRDIACHVLLIHNLPLNMMYSIDYPMWSVATEWQIYFAFALFLLPLWRRFGTVAMLAGAFVAVFVLNGIDPYPRFHFLGLFALGMASAVIAVAPATAQSRSIPWGWIAAGLFVCFSVALLIKPDVFWRRLVLADTLVGVITTCLILHCIIQLNRSTLGGAAPTTGLILRLLQSRFAVTVGVFSYSLYLIHAVVLALVQLLVLGAGLSPAVRLAAFEFLGVPLALLVSYAFHIVFERPFLVHRKKETFAEIARDAALSPAP